MQIRTVIAGFMLMLLSAQPVCIKAQTEEKSLYLQEIWASGKFFPEYVSGLRSMNDGLHYTTLEQGEQGKELVMYSYENKDFREVMLSAEELEGMVDGGRNPITDYQFSADEQKVLIANQTESIYRYSSKSQYYVFDFNTRKFTKLITGSNDKQMYATFSPSGNKVAYVLNNNLFVKDLETGENIQITDDGEKNRIINGASDWVYEEELELVRAFEWSPDGEKIAFFRFDESEVKEFSMDMYGSLYPEQYRFKYPKAGEDNSKVTIHIHNLNEKKTLQAEIKEDYEYIPRIEWTPGGELAELAIMLMNRHQNKLNILLADAQSGKTRSAYEEKSKTYIDIPELEFFKKEKQFVITSEQDGYNHIYIYNLKGKKVKQVTKGKWVVTEYYGLDEKNGKIYYQAAEESPMQRQVYSIGTDGKNKVLLTEKEGDNSADFSKGFKFFINNHSTANTPPFISLHKADGKLQRVLKSNENLKKVLEQYNLPDKEFFNFKTSEGDQLNGWMIKPADFDATKEYPVFMYVYGGPGHQTVRDNWGSLNYMWYQFLAQKGYIVVSVDGRGTGARGAEFKKCTYKQLGKYEHIDQIETAKYLGGLDYVDKNRIGIMGWSFGGYLSSLCLTKGAEFFKMAIAVAPVTNWRYYDTIYTERFMQTPQENPDGYDDNSPINHVSKLDGAYLLIHGMADDNVHYQNTADMVSALVKHNKQFDMFAYTNKNHGIYGGYTRVHLFTKMFEFIKENL